MKNLPTHIALNMTSACNMDCSYCYQDKLNSGNRMSNQVLDKVIEMINKTAINGRQFHVSFFGGEPTLAARSIHYFIDNANLDNVSGFSLTTNGTNTDVVNEVAKRGFELSNGRIKTSVLISNKDQRSPHEDISLDHVETGYRFIIAEDNMHEINAAMISELLASDFHGVDFRFDYYQDWSAVDQTEVNRIVELLATMAQTSQRLRYSVPRNHEPVVQKKCPAPHVSIDTNGDIMPCHRMFNSSRGAGRAVGNIVTGMDAALKGMLAFQEEVHFSNKCIGFDKNFGQNDDIYVLDLGTAQYEEKAEDLTPALAVAAEPTQECR